MLHDPSIFDDSSTDAAGAIRLCPLCYRREHGTAGCGGWLNEREPLRIEPVELRVIDGELYRVVDGVPPGVTPLPADAGILKAKGVILCPKDFTRCQTEPWRGQRIRQHNTCGKSAVGKMLRVMQTGDERTRRRGGKAPSHPDAIPWAIVDAHREQVEKNHDQTLERMQERGGLSVVELYCVLNDMHWNDFDWDIDYKVLGRFLFDRVEQHAN